MDRTCVQLALAPVCFFLVLEQLQTATCIREKSEPEISGNLLDPFGDEKQNKSDTYTYIYIRYI